jgi:hypothetical protein
MGIGNQDPDGALLGIVHSEMLDGTDKLADPATGTELGDDGKSFGHGATSAGSQDDV